MKDVLLNKASGLNLKKKQMQIYHNPRCRKSREALAFLNEKGIEVEVIEYLKTPPNRDELEMILMKLNLEPQDIVRRTEDIYKKQLKGKEFNREEWLQILVENPKLIERPIVVKNNKAVIARPLENLEKLL